MPRKPRWFVWVVALGAVWASYWLLTRNRLTVANESGQEVCGLTVAVGGETIAFGDLASGAIGSARFRIGHEEVFEVRFRRADGTEVHEYEGYVVWEEDLFGVAARIAIRPGGTMQFSH